MIPRLPLLHVFACLVVSLAASPASYGQTTTGLTQYSIGEPSGDETEMLAEVNRARANPPAEGQRLASGPAMNYPSSGVGSINELLTSFASYPARPPLAFNADLNASAAAHTADMMATGILQHNSSDGTPFGTRIESFGYLAPTGENIAGAHYRAAFPLVATPWDTESNYETDIYNVDAGSIGHRLNIMEPTFPASNEIGIAQHASSGWDTEDFGGRSTPPLLLGAVFTDNAGTGFYASGEGVGGVTVTAPGFSSYYAVTGASGAYTLPLDLAGPVYTQGEAYWYDASTGQYVYSPFNPAPVVNLTFTDAQGNVSTLAVTLTHTEYTIPGAADPATGFTGVIPAYFDANGVARWDNTEADLVLPASGGFTPSAYNPQEYPLFFDGQAALAGGVHYLAFANGNVFGYYTFLAEAHYLYHFDLGWEYVIDAADTQGGAYLYDFTSEHWFYTSPTFSFPYLYDFTLNSVLYYYPDPSNPGRYNTNGVRWFYDFGSGQIVAL